MKIIFIIYSFPIGPGYVKYVYDRIYKIYKNLTVVHENVKKILKSISEWSSAPMYKRKKDNRDTHLDILYAENQINIKKDQIEITKELIQQSIHENFHLFFNVESAIEENEDNRKLSNCCHSLVKKRMKLMRSIGKSSEDVETKVR